MTRSAIIFILCSFLFVPKTNAQTPLSAFDAKLAELATNMNKKMPVIEEPFRMDSVGTRPGKTIVYNYTIMGSDKLNLDYLATKGSIETKVIENLKSNPKMKAFKDNDVTMIYSYFDEHGKKQISIFLKAAQYK